MAGHIDRDHTFVYENNFYSYLFARQVNALPSHGIRFSPQKSRHRPYFYCKNSGKLAHNREVTSGNPAVLAPDFALAIPARRCFA
ncbi:TPA: hypothetical protein ACTY9I_000112 [Raoultella planticola]